MLFAVVALAALLIGVAGGFALAGTTTESRSENALGETSSSGIASVLAAPVLLSPVDGQIFSVFPRETTLSWAPTTGAASYTLELQLESGGVWVPYPDVRDGVWAGFTSVTAFGFSFVGAQRGRWRVTAYGNDGLPGPTSEWSTFQYTI